MDNQRLLIWASFGLLLWMTYQAWVQDYGPQPANGQPPAETEIRPPAEELGAPPLPTEAVDAPAMTDEAPALEDATTEEAEPSAATVHVLTDVLDMELSTEGGTLQRAILNNYPVAKDQPNVLVELLNTGRNELGMIQTGINAFGDGPKADHRAVFSAEANEYRLDGADELIVPLTWTDGRGITVEKSFRFSRGSYRVDISQRIVNDSEAEWRGADYAQLLRRSREMDRSMFDVDSYSFDGPIIYDGEKSDKLDRDDLVSDGPFELQAANGWVGSIQHHFLSAIVPPADAQYVYNISVRGDVSLASMISTPSIIVPPGGEHTFVTTAFVGPKLQSQLEEINDSLKLTVDYGWLTIISQPLFWLLSLMYSFVANWGVAIIIVTILIKAAFYKLTEASGRSMAKMREIQPRMKALQDRYKDDRQALSQAMMDL